jgi:putative hemolysin
VEQKKFIDIEKIFKEKNPSAYKWTPSFIIRYIKRVLHEEDLNNFQKSSDTLFEFDYCDATVKEFGLKVIIKGLENIPKEGGFIAASNHPLGGIDGIALLQAIGKERKDIVFLVNDILKNLKNFGELFVPVNKLGSTSLDNLRRIEAEFASDKGVVLFPAGLVSRKIDGVVQDLEWNKSFITKAQKYNKPVVPVHLSGQLSNWFYNFSSFRKMLGISLNLEMLYLADEMYKQRGTTFTITIGKPIEASKFGKHLGAKEWAEAVRKHIYVLAKDASAIFKGEL